MLFGIQLVELGLMKMLFFVVIILFWCQDVVEFYFFCLSYLLWVMFLYFGYVDYLYSCFDIVVVDLICILIIFGKEIVVSESEKCIMIIDDLLQVFQQVLDCVDICLMYNEDLLFQGGVLGLFGYDLGCCFELLLEIVE